VRALRDSSQIQFRQALVLKLRVLVPAFFVPTAVSGVAIVALDGVGSVVTVLACLLDGVGSPLIFSVLTLLPRATNFCSKGANCPFSKLG